MFKTIMCATDGSADAERALEAAAGLAAETGATIDVVHVVEYFSSRMNGLTTRVDEPEIRERIDRQVAAATARGVTCVTHAPRAATGRVARRIADLAAELGSDVIVVGTRGHGALAGAMFGSVTQQLLHEAPCPVLAVPPARGVAPAAEHAGTAGVSD